MFIKILIVIIASTTIVSCAEYTVTSQIYMDIKQGREKLGQIVIGLFGNDAPKTVKNFRHICLNGIDGKTYVGTKFHRVIRKFLIQGGDIVSNDGFGSISIYGKYFDDENLTISHSRPGFIGMANRGKNTNGCQFYIITIPTLWLDGKHTIFGKIIKGQEIVHEIEYVKTDSDDSPIQPIIISSCGEIHFSEKLTVTDDDLYTLWNWIQAAGFPVTMSLTTLGIFHYFIRKLNMFC